MAIKLNTLDFSLRESLEKDDAVLQSVIDSIPPKYFFDHDVLTQLEDCKHKAGDQECKGLPAKKINKFGIKAKHRRYQLNPLHRKTVTQIVEDLDKIEKDEAHKQSESSKSTTIEDLQEKLREKIQLLQEQRQSSGSKQAIQMKRNIQKLKEKQKNKVHVKGKYTQVLKKPKSKLKVPATTNLFNKEGKLIYSKFDLSNPVLEEKQASHKESLQKSMRLTLQKKDKVSKLQEQRPEMADALKKKEIWKQALNKSEGIKSKDNLELLKKSFKKKQQLKRKSQKQWQARSEQVSKKKQEKQDKRTKNIQGRKKAKLNNKLKKAAKKGRLVPGFG